MNQKKAEGLIFIIVMGWGSSYLFMKMGLASLQTFNLIALRFGLAFLLMCPLLLYRRKNINLKTVGAGVLMGVTLFGTFTGIMLGLHTTSASNTGFLVSLTVVFVPILEACAQKKKPEQKLVAGILLALLGIGCMTLKSNLSIGGGDAVCILAAFIYSIQIYLTGRFAKEVDALNLGIIQLGVAGGLGIIFSAFLEQPRLPVTSNEWIAVLALGIICSAFGFVMQPVAQQYTTATRTGMMFTMEPVFSAFFGVVFLHEMLGIKGIIGAVLVLLGVWVTNQKTGTKLIVIKKEQTDSSFHMKQS